MLMYFINKARYDSGSDKWRGGELITPLVAPDDETAIQIFTPIAEAWGEDCSMWELDDTFLPSDLMLSGDELIAVSHNGKVRSI